MSQTFVTGAAWLAVVAFAVSAVLFGQSARMPSRRPRTPRAARNRRIGIALSISGPIVVVLAAVAVATRTEEWLLLAIIAFGSIGVVSLAGFVLAPH